MEGIFRIDSEEGIKKTINQLKHTALRALQNYDLDWEQIRFNQLSDTCTFIIQTSKDGPFLLRIHSGMNKAMERLAQHYDKFLTDTEFSLYQSAAEKILSRIIKFRKNGESYGLIHGDLHQGNIVFYNGEPRPIDFGRCGFGYFLYDIAHTILGLYPAQRELVIKGYQSIRELGDDWLLELETFKVMVMIENYCHHAPDPRETEGLKEEQPYAQAIIKNYLSGAPFLFNTIEI